MDDDPLQEKIKRALKIFEGVTETFSGILSPPSDLRPEKRGICVCLGIGTTGILILAYIHAAWYAYVVELILSIAVAILLRCKAAK